MMTQLSSRYRFPSKCLSAFSTTDAISGSFKTATSTSAVDEGLDPLAEVGTVRGTNGEILKDRFRQQVGQSEGDELDEVVRVEMREVAALVPTSLGTRSFWHGAQRGRLACSSFANEVRARRPRSRGYFSSSGGGTSGIWISMLILLGSTTGAFSIQYVTDPGQKITIATRMTWRKTHGIAPQ